MRVSEEFARVVKEIIGPRSPRDAAAEMGVSHTTVYDMLNGRVRSYRVLEQLAEKLGATPDQRRRLFHTAGYVDAATANGAARDAERRVIEVAHLSPEQERIARRLILERPDQLELLGALLYDGRVMHPSMLGLAPGGHRGISPIGG